MPRTRTSSTGSKPVETIKSINPEDHVDLLHVDLDMDNDIEDVPEEEVEYEEIEEEVEVEEEEDEEEDEEEVEEEVEEEEEYEEENLNTGYIADTIEDERMNDTETDAEDGKKHAELLALPPHGSEVYVGGFPQDISEDDLRKFCESAGEVTEVRIMKGKGSTENKGYAFVTYRTKEMASEAINSLSGTELKGKILKCSTSQEKHRLFIGNIPRNWGEEDLKNIVKKIGPGVINVQLVKDPQNSSRNRGFAFVEYYNHACAEYSREKMSDSKFKLDGNDPTVSWADPPKNVEPSSSSQVKAVYVKNLPKDITQDRMRDLFEHHGKIIKVILPPAKAGHENSRFGFVHFAERSSAMKAIKNTEKYEIDGQLIECSLAKPQADQKSSGGANMQKPTMLPTYPSAGGYGFLGGYNALGAGLAQPMVYGRGAAPGGLAMIPMLLPDGRIGYVLQQPGMHSPVTPPSHSRGGRSSGSRGSSEGRRGSSDRGRGRNRYNPY